MRIKNVIVTGILKVLQRINIEDLTVNQLNGLSTSELDSLSGTISNIQEQIQYVRNTVLEADSKARTFKSTIANDVNSVVKSDVLDVDSEMSEFSDTIKNSVAMATSDATATADKILVDYNAYVNGELIEGSMPNMGDASVTSNYVVRAANQSTSAHGIISSNGYYNSITINPIVIELEDYTQGNATADKIASGYSAWVNGLKVQGSLPQLGGDVFGGNGSPTCFDESPIVSSAHNSYVGAFDYPLYGWFPKGNHRVHIPNLIPANIKAGVKVGGANGYILGSYTSDANATADKMLSGYTAYVNGNMIRGNIITRDIHWADVSADDVGFDDSGFYMRMPVGYYPQRGSKAGYSYNHMNKSDLGNASAGNVLSGYTFTSQNGLKISGNITQHTSSGNVQNDSCWIYSDRIYVGFPTGFYPSASFGGMSGVSERYVTFGSLASTLGISGNKIIKGNTICGVSGTAATYDEGVNAAKQGTATAGDVLTGKTFTSSSGVNISGSMPDHTGVPSHINHRRLANGRYEVAVEYGRHGCYWADNSYEYIELSELASDIGLTANKLVSGNNILGIDGSGSGIKVITKNCGLDEGVWTGVSFDGDSYTNIGNSKWVYTHNLGLDPSKVHFVAASMICNSIYYFRITRGYAKNSSTSQYQYAYRVFAYGWRDITSEEVFDNFTYDDINNWCYVSFYLDNYNGTSSSTNNGMFKVYVTPNTIEFNFINNGRNLFAIRSISPRFMFTIGYE